MSPPAFTLQVGPAVGPSNHIRIGDVDACCVWRVQPLKQLPDVSRGTKGRKAGGQWSVISGQWPVITVVSGQRSVVSSENESDTK